MRYVALVLLLCLCAGAFGASRSGSRVQYIGGTRPDIPEKNNGEIRITDRTFFIFLSKHSQVRVPYGRINLLEYGQKVDRRYLAAMISPMFMMMKKREHFLTIGFQGDDGQQEAMIFRIEKEDVRLTLVGLEARTGQQVQFQDEDARIAGKS